MSYSTNGDEPESPWERHLEKCRSCAFFENLSDPNKARTAWYGEVCVQLMHGFEEGYQEGYRQGVIALKEVLAEAIKHNENLENLLQSYGNGNEPVPERREITAQS